MLTKRHLILAVTLILFFNAFFVAIIVHSFNYKYEKISDYVMCVHESLTPMKDCHKKLK